MLSNMLEPFYHLNRYDSLNSKKTMKVKNTLHSLQDVCEELTYQYFPYDIFSLVWEKIIPYDRYIYEDIDHDQKYSFMFSEYVYKGSYKRKNKKKSLKVNKAFRLMYLDDDY
tara:strand:- start:108 stop:443 length:336 start_codon:yes stop_codon:yes gene_type:complete